MARHRNVRNMRYEDELPADEFGRSFDDVHSYAVSPATEAQFLYSRSKNEHTLSAFMESESNIEEESDEGSDEDDHDHLLDSDSNFKMPELDDINSAKLRSGLEEIEGIIGDHFHKPTAVNALLRFNFDVGEAVMEILNKGGRQTLSPGISKIKEKKDLTLLKNSSVMLSSNLGMLVFNSGRMRKIVSAIENNFKDELIQLENMFVQKVFCRYKIFSLLEYIRQHLVSNCHSSKAKARIWHGLRIIALYSLLQLVYHPKKGRRMNSLKDGTDSDEDTIEENKSNDRAISKIIISKPQSDVAVLSGKLQTPTPVDGDVKEAKNESSLISSAANDQIEDSNCKRDSKESLETQSDSVTGNRVMLHPFDKLLMALEEPLNGICNSSSQKSLLTNNDTTVGTLGVNSFLDNRKEEPTNTPLVSLPDLNTKSLQSLMKNDSKANASMCSQEKKDRVIQDLNKASLSDLMQSSQNAVLHGHSGTGSSKLPCKSILHQRTAANTALELQSTKTSFANLANISLAELSTSSFVKKNHTKSLINTDELVCNSKTNTDGKENNPVSTLFGKSSYITSSKNISLKGLSKPSLLSSIAISNTSDKSSMKDSLQKKIINEPSSSQGRVNSIHGSLSSLCNSLSQYSTSQDPKKNKFESKSLASSFAKNQHSSQLGSISKSLKKSAFADISLTAEDVANIGNQEHVSLKELAMKNEASLNTRDKSILSDCLIHRNSIIDTGPSDMLKRGRKNDTKNDKKSIGDDVKDKACDKVVELNSDIKITTKTAKSPSGDELLTKPTQLLKIKDDEMSQSGPVGNDSNSEFSSASELCLSKAIKQRIAPEPAESSIKCELALEETSLGLQQVVNLENEKALKNQSDENVITRNNSSTQNKSQIINKKPSSFGQAFVSTYVTSSVVETKPAEFILPVQIDMTYLRNCIGDNIRAFNFSTPSPDDIVKSKQKSQRKSPIMSHSI